MMPWIVLSLVSFSVFVSLSIYNSGAVDSTASQGPGMEEPIPPVEDPVVEEPLFDAEEVGTKAVVEADSEAATVVVSDDGQGLADVEVPEVVVEEPEMGNTVPEEPAVPVAEEVPEREMAIPEDSIPGEPLPEETPVEMQASLDPEVTISVDAVAREFVMSFALSLEITRMDAEIYMCTGVDPRTGEPIWTLLVSIVKQDLTSEEMALGVVRLAVPDPVPLPEVETDVLYRINVVMWDSVSYPATGDFTVTYIPPEPPVSLVCLAVEDLIALVEGLDPSVWAKKNSSSTMVEKLNTVLALCQSGVETSIS